MQRDKKVISLIYLACGFMCWLLFKEMLSSIWVLVRLPIPTGWMAEPADLIAAVIGVVVFVVMLRNQKVNDFTNDVVTELSRVVWPNRKETFLSTGIVAVLVSICSMILFGFDMLWGALVRVFYQ